MGAPRAVCIYVYTACQNLPIRGMARQMGKDETASAIVLDGLVSALHARGRLRVWSLVITVFGDAIVPRGGKAGLSVLQSIMGRLGIENGALRTAMSRLAADNWVVRKKSGRNSIYALAGSGRHAFDEATKRIYAAGPPEWDGQWTVVMVPSAERFAAADALIAAGFVEAGGAAWLRPETSAVQSLPSEVNGALVLKSHADRVPENVSGFWEVGESVRAYDALTANYQALDDALANGAQLEPLDALAARSLLIHDWRRIVLRDPNLPSQLLPEDWPGENARAVVRSIYTKLAPASERWLDDAGLPPQSDPTRFAERFGIFQSSR